MNTDSSVRNERATTFETKPLHANKSNNKNRNTDYLIGVSFQVP